MYTIKRVFQRQNNAKDYFKSSIKGFFTEFRDLVLQWIEYLLFHSRSVEDILSVLRRFFIACKGVKHEKVSLVSGKC